MNISSARRIMGRDLIGPEELAAISGKLGIAPPERVPVPPIPFSEDELSRARRDGFFLILGIPVAADGTRLTLNNMRSHFGTDPEKSEPCFYNQDWYLNETFARDVTLDFRWYLLRKSVKEESRGKAPDGIIRGLPRRETLPPAILTAFAFFAYYLATGGETLWENDFVWCSDTDGNGDRVYTGRYRDPRRVSKNGFNIHRHLSIHSRLGAAPMR